jgi:hypothetical protein
MHSSSILSILELISARRRVVIATPLVLAVHDKTAKAAGLGGAAAYYAEQWRRPLAVRGARATRAAGIDGIAGAARCNLRMDLTVISKVSASSRSQAPLVVAQLEFSGKSSTMIEYSRGNPLRYRAAKVEGLERRAHGSTAW